MNDEIIRFSDNQLSKMFASGTIRPVDVSTPEIPTPVNIEPVNPKNRES